MKKAPGTSDEDYVLDLCDAILDRKASRQHRFPFLLGDGERPRRLPVDAFYPEINLVIEYHEQQHSESVAFFDKPDRITVSGVSRGKQRSLYDSRRREVLPQHGIRVIVLSYSDLAFRANKRLQRDEPHDSTVIRRILIEHGIDMPKPSAPVRA